MKKSFIFKSPKKLSIQSDYIIDNCEIMNNTAENYYPSQYTLSGYNTQSNTCEHIHTLTNHQFKTNSIITKRISIKDINKNQYTPSITNFTNIPNNLLPQKLLPQKRKTFLSKLILIQSIVKAFLFRKKFNKKKICTKNIILIQKRQKQNIKTVKIKFKINTCCRSMPISNNHFITKNVIKNKIIDTKKIILIQKIFRNSLRTKTKSLINCLKNIFNEYEGSKNKNKSIIYQNSYKKVEPIKTFFIKKNIENKNLFLMTSNDKHNYSLKNVNRELLNAINSSAYQNKTPVNKIPENSENDDLTGKTFTYNFTTVTSTNKIITKKQYNKLQIVSYLNKNEKFRNYVYSHKTYKTINERNNEKRKTVLSVNKSRNSKVYSKKKIKFLNKEKDSLNSEKKTQINSNLNKTVMIKRLNIINDNKKIY